MLSNAPVYPTLPVTDLQKSREFYEKTLGLSVAEEMPHGLVLKAGSGTQLYIYQRGPSKADHTLAGFRVENINETVDQLFQKGVVFEKYDFPGIKTNEKGIAEQDSVKAAWFKDPDGNILGITEVLRK